MSGVGSELGDGDGETIFQRCERAMRRDSEPEEDGEEQYVRAKWDKVIRCLSVLAATKESNEAYRDTLMTMLAYHSLKFSSDVLPTGYNADFEMGYLHGLYVFCFPEEMVEQAKRNKALELKKWD